MCLSSYLSLFNRVLPKATRATSSHLLLLILCDMSSELLKRDRHNEASLQINSFATLGWPQMCMNSIHNWSAVKVAVPSKVQQHLRLEETFVLMYQGKEITLYSILTFIMIKKPLRDNDQTALQALLQANPTSTNNLSCQLLTDILS